MILKQKRRRFGPQGFFGALEQWESRRVKELCTANPPQDQSFGCLSVLCPYITLHYITLHYITLHYITLYIQIYTCIHTYMHWITLHYITCQHTYVQTYTYTHTTHTHTPTTPPPFANSSTLTSSIQAASNTETSLRSWSVQNIWGWLRKPKEESPPQMYSATKPASWNSGIWKRTEE